MNITNWIKAAFRTDPIDLPTAPSSPPAIGAASILAGQLQEAIDLRGRKDRYTLADNLINTDERLFSAVELLALMIMKAVSGFTIRPEDTDDKISTPSERKALKVAQDLYRKLNMPRLAYRYTKDLWKYGDAVDQIKFGIGIEGLIPLPLFVISAVDKRSQIGETGGDFVISDPKFYAIDEQDGKVDIKTQVLRWDRVLHISFDSKRSWIRDNLGRWTFNVWSTAPINSLMGILLWKKILMNNDQIWRNRSMPREHHKLDLSSFDPSKFAGTHQEKLDAAKTAAETAISSYASVNARRSADQGFVTGMNVEIGYIEPKTTHYNDPSPIISQINTLIGGPFGTPGELLGGTDTGGATSLAQSSTFFALRAEMYLDPIREAFEILVRRHINMVEPGIDQKVVDRVVLKTRLILDKDRIELAQMISVLAGAKALTVTELREIWGLDPMTDEQELALTDWITTTQNPGAGDPNSDPTSPDEALADANGKKNTDNNPTRDITTPGQNKTKIGVKRT